MAQILNANQLNTIGQQSGFGGNFSSVGLPPISSTSTTIQPSMMGTQPLNLAPTTSTPIPNVANLMSAGTPSPTTPPAPVTPVAPATSPGLFDRITGGLSDLISGSKNQASDTAVAVDAATQPYAQQINELTTKIKMGQANAVANQEKALQTGETTGFASREAQNVARTDAIQQLKDNALLEGMQGNYNLAEAHATTAITAKYAEMNKKIEIAKTNIYNNYDSFSPSEKKQADLTLLRLDKDDAFAKNAMENEKAVQAVILTALSQSAQNGVPVPSAVLSRAKDMTDPTEVNQLLAPYLRDSAKIQSTIDQHNKAVADLANTNASTAKIRAETGVLPGGNPTTNMPYNGNYKSPTDYVNAVLSKQGVSYQSVQSNTPAGYLSVIENATGQTGTVDQATYKKDPSIYTVMFNNTK